MRVRASRRKVGIDRAAIRGCNELGQALRNADTRPALILGAVEEVRGFVQYGLGLKLGLIVCSDVGALHPKCPAQPNHSWWSVLASGIDEDECPIPGTASSIATNVPYGIAGNEISNSDQPANHFRN